MRFLPGLFATLLSSAVLLPSIAGAAAPPPVYVEEPPPGPTTSHWYGWQTLTVDGAALFVAFVGSGVAHDNDGVAWASAGTYAFGPALVHIGHGRWGTAIADVLIRVGAPVALASFASADRGNCEGESGCGWSGAITGLFLGYAGAVALDAAVLSWERVPAPPPTVSHLTWSPTLGAAPHGVSAGVAGTF